VIILFFEEKQHLIAEGSKVYSQVHVIPTAEIIAVAVQWFSYYAANRLLIRDSESIMLNTKGYAM